MDRRCFLTTGATVALLPLVEAPLFAAPASGDARLNRLFEEIFQEQVSDSPELATSLGLDKGANAKLKSLLDTDPVPVARRKDLARTRRAIRLALSRAENNISNAAKLLGISRPTLYDLIKQYRLQA